MKNKEVARWLGVAIIAATSWHSVEEIHYLKTFYPKTFTVEEAYLAALVEVIKIALITFPLLLAMYLLRE